MVGDEAPGWRRSSTPGSTSTSTCTWPATRASASTTSSRRTTTPTTSRATAACPPRPARRSTSTAMPRPTTTTSPSTTAGARARLRAGARAAHPGHRPEHTAFALIDAERGDEPWAVLTGDSLFVGDIARPDLAVDKDEGARAIFHSLHERLLTLPDTCEVWPGHVGGSLCGGPGMDMKASSTIGYEREHSRCSGSTTRTSSRGGRPRAASAAAQLREHRGAQPGAAVGGERRGAPAHAAPGRPGAPTAPWSSTCAPSCSSTRPTSPTR